MPRGHGTLVSSLALTVGLLAHQAGALSPPSLSGGDTPGGGLRTVRNSYIVEFAQQATQDNVADALGIDVFTDTVQRVLDLDVGLSIRLHLNYDLFQGVSVKFPDHQSAVEGLAKLKSLNNVKAIHPNRIIPHAAALNPGGGDASNSLLGRLSGLGQSLSSSQSTTCSRDAGETCESNATYTTLQMAQVDKLHDKGIFGNGVKICIIDTGIDYTHPALGGAFGPGHLVAFGRDLIGDNYTGPDDTPMPDDDPRDTCNGHGTECAGVIAAQPGNEYGIVGVAPNVTLGAYRAWPCHNSAGTSEDVILQAYNEAYQDGCQIISSSSGGPSGGYDPASALVSSIVAKGVPFINSGGNNGGGGLFQASSPALGKWVTDVNSVDNKVRAELGYFGNFTTNGGEPQAFKWLNDTPSAWPAVDLPLWAFHYRNNTVDPDDPTDNCTKLFDDDTPDLSGRVVLLPYYYCGKNVLAKQAAAHGAQYVIFHANLGASWVYTIQIDTLTKPAGIVAAANVFDTQAAAWLEALDAGSNIRVRLANPDTLPLLLTYEPIPPSLGGGLPSRYNSWGPTANLDLKPDFMAPGGGIFTTNPVPMGSWTVVAGTSFAAPFVAGVVALIAQIRSTLDPATIKSLLSTTAVTLPFYDGTTVYPWPAPPLQQGTGIIQAFDAAYSTTVLSRTSIAFNDTDNFDPTANFTIKNLDSTGAVTYNLGHTPAHTAYTFAAPGGNDANPASFPGLNFTEEHATIEFAGGTSQVTVPAGGEVQISLTITPPAGPNPVRFPVYSGWITLNSTNGENLSLPYSGVIGSAKNIQVLASVYIYNNTDIDQKHIHEATSYRFPFNESDLNENYTYPVLGFDVVIGTVLADVQLISWDGSARNASTQEPIPAGTSLGSLPYFPFPFLGPTDRRDGNLDEEAFNGTMADGSIAPEGTYIIEVSALRRFGDVNRQADYQRRRTPPITLSYVYP